MAGQLSIQFLPRLLSDLVEDHVLVIAVCNFEVVGQESDRRFEGRQESMFMGRGRFCGREEDHASERIVEMGVLEWSLGVGHF